MKLFAILLFLLLLPAGTTFSQSPNKANEGTTLVDTLGNSPSPDDKYTKIKYPPAWSVLHTKARIIDTEGMIREKCENIQSNLSVCDTMMINIPDESSNGGYAMAYYYMGNLQLIEVFWLGDAGKRIVEYFFENEQLIFALDRNFEYGQPVSSSKGSTKKVINDQISTSGNSIMTEDQYFFKDENLFVWYNTYGKKADLTLDSNVGVGKGIVLHAHNMKRKIEAMH